MFAADMLVSAHIRFRRHCSKLLVALAVLAFALTALTAHAAVMNAAPGDHHGMNDHGMSDVAGLCLALGSLAIVGAAVFGVRRFLRRLVWVAAAPLSPAGVPSAALRACAVRAGPSPPPALLQVFRF
jgi:predicted metal-binding membrane protein